MRLIAVLGIALWVGACGAPSWSPGPTSSGNVTQSPPASALAPTPDTESSPGPPLVSTPSPTFDVEPAPTSHPSPIEAALTYASVAGFELDSESQPATSDHAPLFDELVLHRVSLRLADATGAALDVYLDDDGAIRVVEDGYYDRPTGGAASRTEVLRAAERYLGQIGIDPTSGTLHVALGKVGDHWYLTFDRAIAGYPVANAPMWWWITGDKAYLELRADASLIYLYAIRPDHLPVPTILDSAVLDARLANVVKVSPVQLATRELALLWVRARDPVTARAGLELSLNYCATQRGDYFWHAWCIDAATGEFSTEEGGVD